MRHLRRLVRGGPDKKEPTEEVEKEPKEEEFFNPWHSSAPRRASDEELQVPVVPVRAPLPVAAEPVVEPVAEPVAKPVAVRGPAIEARHLPGAPTIYDHLGEELDPYDYGDRVPLSRTPTILDDLDDQISGLVQPISKDSIYYEEDPAKDTTTTKPRKKLWMPAWADPTADFQRRTIRPDRSLRNNLAALKTGAAALRTGAEALPTVVRGSIAKEAAALKIGAAEKIAALKTKAEALPTVVSDSIVSEAAALKTKAKALPDSIASEAAALNIGAQVAYYETIPEVGRQAARAVGKQAGLIRARIPSKFPRLAARTIEDQRRNLKFQGVSSYDAEALEERARGNDMARESFRNDIAEAKATGMSLENFKESYRPVGGHERQLRNAWDSAPEPPESVAQGGGSRKKLRRKRTEKRRYTKKRKYTKKRRYTKKRKYTKKRRYTKKIKY